MCLWCPGLRFKSMGAETATMFGWWLSVGDYSDKIAEAVSFQVIKLWIVACSTVFAFFFCFDEDQVSICRVATRCNAVVVVKLEIWRVLHIARAKHLETSLSWLCFLLPSIMYKLYFIQLILFKWNKLKWVVIVSFFIHTRSRYFP